MKLKQKFALSLIGLALPLAVTAAPESYTLDPYHSFLHFEVEHLNGMSRVRGRFDKVSGKITLDQTAKIASLDVTVPTAAISTGDNDKGSRSRSRDEHLRSPDFFNVTEFPTLTFKSTKVVFKGDMPTAIEGNATLLGVTKPLTLQVENFKCGPHPATKKAMCGGNASGTIKRSDFGMKFLIPVVGDEQKLWMGMESYKD
jgi:polyisoprenoid-binding protein YceI